MKIVFFGTPIYVIPVLEKLHKDLRGDSNESPIAAVVTQGPKPVSRNKILNYSPVDTWAHKRRIPIYHTAQKLLEDGIKADIGVLTAYGALLPETVLNYFPYGILNIHPSLLPSFRGASPIQATIATNSPVGVSIIKLDDQMDHGPIVTQFTDELLEDETTEKLRERLFIRSADVLVDLIEPYIKGKITLKSQDHHKATYTKLIRNEHGFIPYDLLSQAMKGNEIIKELSIPFIKDYSLMPNAYSLSNFIHSLSPWPGAWTMITLNSTLKTQKRLKILKAHVEANPQTTTNNSQLILDEVQIEGKQKVTWKQFKEGYPEAEF